MDRKKRRFVKEDFQHLRVAIVHYWLVSWRGGEKVVESILKLFPGADIYTLFYDKKVCSPHLKNRNVYTSCLNLPVLRGQYQKLFPLYPLGIRSLRPRQQYDLIISSESGPAKGFRHSKTIPHLCYVHTPMRYCWGYMEAYLDSLPPRLRKLAAWRFQRLAEWDLTTVENVDRFVANSENVARRIKRYYGKESTVCFPPIDLGLFDRELKNGRGSHYLSFGAITPYKNIGLLIDTFNQLDRELVIIGSGSEKEKLERIAGPNITFLGHLPMNEVLDYVANSRALLFPGEEDFGMIPLEVMSQGVPVIAFGKGGALETVHEDRHHPDASSGLFFKSPTVECLKEAIARFEAIEDRFDPNWIRQRARKFGEDHFLDSFTDLTLDLLNNGQR